MSDEAMHKDFETWAMSQGHIARELEREGDGYKKPSVHWQWQAWQAATRAAVPDGWKVVPVEPTNAMLAVGCELTLQSPNITCAAYCEMLAAAPEAQP